MTTASAKAHVPSIILPLRFVTTGLVSLFLGMTWLAFRPILLAGYHYSPEFVALTHLFALGWVTSIMMGAMYQLVPVALETRLHSERLARWQNRNIVDLGLVYDVRIEGAKVTVTMTLTTPGCPMHESLSWGVKAALLGLEHVDEAEVNVVWDPPWTPDRMSHHAPERAGLR